MSVTVGFLPLECGDRRLAITPSVADLYRKQGMHIKVHKKALSASFYGAGDFEKSDIVTATKTLVENSDVIVSINGLDATAMKSLSAKKMVVSMFNPLTDQHQVEQLNTLKVTACGLNWIPRTSRAQMMDVLSSQASTAGYQAALLGATHSPRFFPMLTTAAGTIRPAKVMVIGTGVAGLQAIATAKRLGAMVEAYDIRPETREQVESLGGRFIDLGIDAKTDGGYARELTQQEKDKQNQILADHVAQCDVLICTAAVFGRAAPVIVTEKMVKSMQSHAVIVDLAAVSGGNCALTKAGQTVDVQGVQILGPIDLPSQVGVDASQMLAKNIFNYLSLYVKDSILTVDLNDDLIQGSLMCHQGKLLHTHFKSKTGVTKNA